MKILLKLILCASLLVNGLVAALAQQTQYLDQNMNPLDSNTHAVLVRSVHMLEDSSCFVEVRYLSGGIRMQGTYADPALSRQHGHFTFFFANGTKESEGDYYNGQKVGVWKRWDWEGNAKPDRHYPRADTRTGRGISTPAHYPGGIEALNAYVATELRYPEEALKLGAEGWVYVAFVIDEIGAVKNIEILQSSHKLLNTEARRIVNCMPQWHPATDNGAAVESRFILPIVFDSKRYAESAE